MSVATVKSVATRFLINQTPEVLALKGAWGVGKTYAWNKIVLEQKDYIKFPKYCYISLFGVTSLQELFSAIVIKTQTLEDIRKGKIQSKKEPLLNWKGGLYHLIKIINLPYLKNLSISLDSIAPHLIKDTIICLDDFERLNDHYIKPDDILGFISSLKESKNCKVVLIFNDEELNSKKDVYKKYREKVIDIELLFSPSAIEAADLVIPQPFPYKDLIKKYTTLLEIKNIRILRKIIDLISLINSELEKHNFHPGVIQQAITTIILLVWSSYETNEKKPSIDFILKWNEFLWNYENEKENNLQKNEWATLLKKYGFKQMDGFDNTINKVIETGYIEESGLIEEAVKIDSQLRFNEIENAYAKSWDLFHNTFVDNSAELTNALNEYLKKHVHHTSPTRLNSIVRLFRELGNDSRADELIEFYIKERSNEKKIFDLEKHPFSEQITDSGIVKRFSQEYVKTQEVPSLIAVVKSISQKNGWSKNEIKILENASTEDFFNLFNLDHGDDLELYIRTCLQFEGFPEYLAIGQKVREALERIGKECRLNEIRVKRYGIKIN